jgi:hypothetical protein
MEPATASVRIKRSRAAVGEMLADLSRRPEYLDHFLVDWTITSDHAQGPGAAARLRAKGGGADAALEFVVAEVTPERIVEKARSGRRLRRDWLLVYELEEVAPDVTQVTFTLELLKGSMLDQATWSLTRTHLERQYARAMLRLKALLEGLPPVP